MNLIDYFMLYLHFRFRDRRYFSSTTYKPLPLFFCQVQVEHCPNEVFIHLSATRCWDMVRDRVNHEIRKQHSLGRTGVPALQPPGSLDGLEMFGLTSPAIIKVQFDSLVLVLIGHIYYYLMCALLTGLT